MAEFPISLTENIVSRGRRSSILKMPRAQTPPDTDTEDYTNTKSIRRVSFAACNLVKTFMNDPDKNTIWDSTYEEEVFHSDSSQEKTKSQASIHTESTIIKSTITSITKTSTVRMDSFNIQDQENIPLDPMIFNTSYMPENMTSPNEVSMEITLGDIENRPSKLIRSVEKKKRCVFKEIVIHNEESQMELTLQDTLNNKPEEESLMEFNCQAPNTLIPLKDNEPFKDILVKMQNDSPQLEDSMMEFTCQPILNIFKNKEHNLSVDREYKELGDLLANQNKSLKQVRDCLQYEESLNMVKTVNNISKTMFEEVLPQPQQDESMEFTCQRPPPFPIYKDASLDNVNQDSQKIQNESLFSSKELKIVNDTRELIFRIPECVKVSKIDESMEFTNVAPILKETQNDSVMEFTCQVPIINRFNHQENQNGPVGLLDIPLKRDTEEVDNVSRQIIPNFNENKTMGLEEISVKHNQAEESAMDISFSLSKTADESETVKNEFEDFSFKMLPEEKGKLKSLQPKETLCHTTLMHESLKRPISSPIKGHHLQKKLTEEVSNVSTQVIPNFNENKTMALEEKSVKDNQQVEESAMDISFPLSKTADESETIKNEFEDFSLKMRREEKGKLSNNSHLEYNRDISLPPSHALKSLLKPNETLCHSTLLSQSLKRPISSPIKGHHLQKKLTEEVSNVSTQVIPNFNENKTMGLEEISVKDNQQPEESAMDISFPLSKTADESETIKNEFEDFSLKMHREEKGKLSNNSHLEYNHDISLPPSHALKSLLKPNETLCHSTLLSQSLKRPISSPIKGHHLQKKLTEEVSNVSTQVIPNFNENKTMGLEEISVKDNQQPEESAMDISFPLSKTADESETIKNEFEDFSLKMHREEKGKLSNNSHLEYNRDISLPPSHALKSLLKPNETICHTTLLSESLKRPISSPIKGLHLQTKPTEEISNVSTQVIPNFNENKSMDLQDISVNYHHQAEVSGIDFSFITSQTADKSESLNNKFEDFSLKMHREDKDKLSNNSHLEYNRPLPPSYALKSLQPNETICHTTLLSESLKRPISSPIKGLHLQTKPSEDISNVSTQVIPNFNENKSMDLQDISVKHHHQTEVSGIDFSFITSQTADKSGSLKNQNTTLLTASLKRPVSSPMKGLPTPKFAKSDQVDVHTAKNVLYTQKIPDLDLTSSKSPNKTLADDTQLLINCTYPVSANTTSEKCAQETDSNNSSLGCLAESQLDDDDLVSSRNEDSVFAFEELKKKCEFKVERTYFSALMAELAKEGNRLMQLCLKDKPSARLPSKMPSFKVPVNIVAESAVPVVVVKTLKEKIAERQKSLQRKTWTFVTTSGVWHYFETLFGALSFKAELDLDSGKVLQLQTRTNLSDRSYPHCSIILHLFLEKLTEDQITPAIGKHYDILSLLDYIDLFMNKVYDYSTAYVNLTHSHKIKIDENHRVNIKVFYPSLLIASTVLVDMRTPDNIEEEHISVENDVGNVKVEDIRKLVKGCPFGIAFMPAFVAKIGHFFSEKRRKMDLALKAFK